MRLTAAFTAFFTLCASTWPAYSENNPPVSAIVGFRTGGTDLENQFRTYLQDSLKGGSRVKLIPDGIVGTQVDDVWNSQAKDANAQLDEAFKNYVKGKRLYEQLDVDEAIKALSQSARGYRESISVLKENRYLLASHLYLGMALVIRGSVPEGREFIRQMIVLDPSRERHQLPQREFPPKIVALHKQITQEVINSPSATVSINTRPNGAVVYFDGVQQEPTPLRLSKVPSGEHFIVAEKKGYGKLLKRIVVDSGNVTVDEQLEEWEPLMPYAFAKRNDPVSNDLLLKLGSSLGSSILILGRLSEPANEKPRAFVQLYDVRSKEFSKIESVQLDRGKVKKSAEELAKKVSNNITVAGLVVAQITQEPMEELKPSTVLPSPRMSEPQRTTLAEDQHPFYKTWWFWTIVGVAVAGGGGFLLMNSGSKPGYHVVRVDNPILP